MTYRRPTECRCPEIATTDPAILAALVGVDLHTGHVSTDISDQTLRALIDMEECPIERRALVRCLVNRRHHIGAR